MEIIAIIPDTKDKLESGIAALEWLMKQPETDDKSKTIYKKTLISYKEKLKQIGGK